jgi:hypothetical protein
MGYSSGGGIRYTASAPSLPSENAHPYTPKRLNVARQFRVGFRDPAFRLAFGENAEARAFEPGESWPTGEFFHAGDIGRICNGPPSHYRLPGSCRGRFRCWAADAGECPGRAYFDGNLAHFGVIPAHVIEHLFFEGMAQLFRSG